MSIGIGDIVQICRDGKSVHNHAEILYVPSGPGDMWGFLSEGTTTYSNEPMTMYVIRRVQEGYR